MVEKSRSGNEVAKRGRRHGGSHNQVEKQDDRESRGVGLCYALKG